MARVYQAKELKGGKLSWLIYGTSRVGKTALIGTFRPPICITNFPNENGVTTLAGHSDVTVYEIEKCSDLDEYPEFIAKENARRVAAGLLPFATVAVDSLTSWLELQQVELGRPLKIPAELVLISKWSQSITGLIDRLRPLDAEKVYTATLALNTDEITGKKHGGPDMFKSLARRVPAKVDATVLLESEAVKNEKNEVTIRRFAWMVPHDDMPAGLRGYVGDPCIEAPSYAKILTEIAKGTLFD